MINLVEFKDEELDDELMLYFEKSRSGFMMIRHPLVFSVPYFKGDNARLNQQLKYKKDALKICEEKGDFDNYVFLHERPYRLEAFLKIINQLEKNPIQYWGLLRDVWVDSEFPSVNKDVWKSLFMRNLPHKHSFMSDEDKVTFNNLPDKVTIYRGYKGKYKNGLSWTLQKTKAEWFSNRFDDKGEAKVIEKTVPKRKIFAYINQRNEQEIIHF